MPRGQLEVLAYVDETEATRKDPDWALLVELIDQGCRQKGLFTQDGRPSYTLLGKAIGRSGAIIYGIVDDHNLPRYDTLVSLAAYFGQPRSVWLEAGGFPPRAYPPKIERMLPALREEYSNMAPDQQQDLINALQVLRDQINKPQG